MSEQLQEGRGKNDPELDEMISDLVEEYLEEEFVSFYKASFMEVAVGTVQAMVVASLDPTLLPDALADRIEVCLRETLQEVWLVPVERALLPFLAKGLPVVEEGTVEERLLDMEARELSAEQRTEAWYTQRHNLLTATGISSLFSSASKVNEVIHEKCRPWAPSPPLSVYDARHWGVRYEPVSRMVYERVYKTKVREYGCIRHPDIPFVGASPDGVNVDPRNRGKYGRLVEIKNVVSREITGDPLDDYWIQMQVQMEVCGLDLCDFVETQFKEFADSEDFFARRDDYVMTGCLLHFVGLLDPLANHYVYLPLQKDALWGWRLYDAWITKEANSLRHSHRLVKPIYWRLEEFSCMVVQRNRAWFSAAEPRLHEVWATVLRERVEGYGHRAAKRRENTGTRVILLQGC
jgi:putative phage-type endonuclease